MKYACFNGKIIEERDSLIAANSKANFFDFGVYESIKVEKGKAFHPELNIERLFGSAAAIGLEIKQSKEEILGWIDGLIKANKADNALLRVMVLGETEKEPFQIRIFALSFHFYPGKFYAKGAKAITFKGERYLPQAKTLNLLLNYVAVRKASEQGAIEALLVDREGCITEGTRSNFFAIKGDTLITPPKETILEGTTKKIIEALAAKTMDVREEKIKKENLGQYDEFFMTSTVFGIMPLSNIDGKTFRIGEKTKKLAKAFNEYCKNYFNSQA